MAISGNLTGVWTGNGRRAVGQAISAHLELTHTGTTLTARKHVAAPDTAPVSAVITEMSGSITPQGTAVLRDTKIDSHQGEAWDCLTGGTLTLKAFSNGSWWALGTRPGRALAAG